MTSVRKMQLVRFGVWAGAATIAVLIAIIAANTETGVRRIATLVSPEPQGEPVRGARGPNIASRFDAELEARKLSESVRILSADRDRLIARVAVLERNLDDVTGSIPANPPGTQKQAPVPLLPQVPPQAMAPPPAQPAAPPAAGAPAPAPGRVTTTAITPPGPSESVATKTEFGIDVGGNASMDGLRTLWTNLKAAQPAMFQGLRPVIAIREGAKPGAVELRLIAGPLANAGVAARLCASLAAVGQVCQPAVFDGQRLALQ
jgi:hypothetical protein